MVYPLHELKPGERAETVQVISEPSMSLRLGELGFTAVTQVTCIPKGRRGYMSTYQIQGTTTALRPQDAREALIQVLNPG